jgi:phenylalanyl-tRNA synthetase beta chain
LPRFPSVSRDVTFLAAKDISFASVAEAAACDASPLCAGVVFVDSFEAKELGGDQRALTLRFEYRSAERTLSEEEVEQAHAEILARIEQKLGLRPRA